MFVITLPDGSTRSYEGSVTVSQVAADIGQGLAKSALGGVVNGKAVDVSYLLSEDTDLEIITDKSPRGIEIIRHSTAHLLAQAVKSIYPNVQVTIGPVIENGFYYDFAYAGTFNEDDLLKIEAKMNELVKKDLLIERMVYSRDKAVELFESLGEHYKAEIIKDIPAEEELSVYKQGDFLDLCRGPHVPNTGKLKAFKLTKISGAYWKGDANNPMLQRIYGTAWSDKKQLKIYLNKLEEAVKRDHRKLAKKLDLFHMQAEAPGMIFWHDAGWQLWLTIENYMRDYCNKHGYKEVKTPQLVDKSLWEKSGHMAVFADDMFMTQTENREYAIKPMNCPCHIQIYNQGLKSYRDLPYRLSEFGHVHRSEASGTLHGLLRVRSLVQDDGHIFCTEQQIESEAQAFIQGIYQIYKDFGFENISVKIATRPEKRVGSDESWDKAEACLVKAVESQEIAYSFNEGEGAFYGPKIEFSMKDCLDRVWQCGTLQVDFSMPNRLSASYIDEQGDKKVPVLLHRAFLGSMERFIGILIEHYAGLFPLWLAPTQVVLINITEKQLDFVDEVRSRLEKEGLRVTVDARNEKMGLKIREQTLKKIPYLLIVGDNEVSTNSVSVRTCSGEKIDSVPVDELLSHLKQEIETKGAHRIMKQHQKTEEKL